MVAALNPTDPGVAVPALTDHSCEAVAAACEAFAASVADRDVVAALKCAVAATPVDAPVALADCSAAFDETADVARVVPTRADAWVRATTEVASTCRKWTAPFLTTNRR